MKKTMKTAMAISTKLAGIVRVIFGMAVIRNPATKDHKNPKYIKFAWD